MADEDGERSSEWGWLGESDLREGCTLIFARDVTQDQMFEALGLDPLSAQMEEWGMPDHLVRVGQVGAWTFAIDPFGAASSHLIGEHLSGGTEVVVIVWTGKPNGSIEYWADGTLVTRFETYRVCDRDGSDPDRFLREMRQAGMTSPSSTRTRRRCRHSPRYRSYRGLIPPGPVLGRCDRPARWGAANPLPDNVTRALEVVNSTC